MKYDLDRFKNAQEEFYDDAFEEMRQGMKVSHWIWFIFPQVAGLGYSSNAQYFGLDGLGEAQAYYEDNFLRKRLEDICAVLLTHKGKDIKHIMGYIDAKKLKSSMTIFDMVAPNSIFDEVLREFFDSERDELTIKLAKG